MFGNFVFVKCSNEIVNVISIQYQQHGASSDYIVLFVLMLFSVSKQVLPWQVVVLGMNMLRGLQSETDDSEDEGMEHAFQGGDEDDTSSSGEDAAGVEVAFQNGICSSERSMSEVEGSDDGIDFA